jgi:hypothetical protein
MYFLCPNSPLKLLQQDSLARVLGFGDVFLWPRMMLFYQTHKMKKEGVTYSRNAPPIKKKSNPRPIAPWVSREKIKPKGHQDACKQWPP